MMSLAAEWSLHVLVRMLGSHRAVALGVTFPNLLLRVFEALLSGELSGDPARACDPGE